MCTENSAILSFILVPVDTLHFIAIYSLWHKVESLEQGCILHILIAPEDGACDLLEVEFNPTFTLYVHALFFDQWTK